MDRKINIPWYRKRQMRWIGLGIGAALLIIWLITNGSRSTYAIEKESLIVRTVDSGYFQEYLPLTGEVWPIQTYYLDATEGGIVDTVYAENGQPIRKGEPIIKLTNTSLELNYMTQQTRIMEQINTMSNTRIQVEEQTLRLREQLLQTQFELAKMERTYMINEALLKDSVIAANDFKDIRDEYLYLIEKEQLIQEKMAKDSVLRIRQIRQLEPSIDMMQRNLDYIEDALRNLVVRAPVSGQLSSLRVLPGQSVERGERLAQIDDLSSFKIRAKVDQHYIDRVQEGMQATFETQGQVFDLQIVKVYPEVLQGRFEVDLEFLTDPPAHLKRGQTVTIRLALSDNAPALLLPKGAYYRQTGGQWVYVLNTDGDRAHRKPIVVGQQNPLHYQVLEGLAPGDKVIVSSYKGFENNDQLILQ